MDNNFNYRDVQQVQNFSTPQNAPRQQDQQAPQSTPYSAGRELSSFPEGTPSSDARMKTRKARITLDENDHLVIMRACVANKNDMTVEGKKTVFWEIIRQALLRETGKDLALPKQVVERAMRDRHFHLESHPEERGKPSEDEMSKLTDEWMKHMETIDGAEARWKIPARPVDRRKPSEKHGTPAQETPILPPGAQAPASRTNKRSRDQQQQQGTFLLATRDTPQTGNRPLAARPDDTLDQMDNVFQNQSSQAQLYSSVYGTAPQAGPPPSHGLPPAKRARLGDDPDTPQRVVIEGGLSKEDWFEIVGNVKAHDPRIPALEAKIDTLIDTTRRTHQLLIQLLKNQARRPGQGNTLGVNGGDIANLGMNGDAGGMSGVGD